MSEKKNTKTNLDLLFKDLLNISQEEDPKENHLQKSQIIKRKEMISYKILQNIDLTTYDYIFLDRVLCNKKIQDFSSFKELIKEIKKKYLPDKLNESNIQTIKNEGKFSFNKYNITKLIPFNEKKTKNVEISINNKYIIINDIKSKDAIFYLNKSFFKGKHCFEIEVLKIFKYEMMFGILNINYVDTFKKEFCSLKNNELRRPMNYGLMKNFDCFKLEGPIFMKKNDSIFHHYISFGDIIGLCYDLDKKLLYVYLNGEIINTFSINILTGSNNSFIPFISLDKFAEIIINTGDKLKYEDNYKKMGFIPLDEKNKNNFEESKLIEVTNEYINILLNNGKSIINNKNITYSDINQIYHDIFDFLGNVSFQYSYIINNCFIKYIELCNDDINDNLELYYICIKYILNSVTNQKALLINIILNLVESIHIYLMKGNPSFKKLYQLLIYLFSKKDIINIISNFSQSKLKKIFLQIFIPFLPYQDFFQKVNLDLIINSNKINSINSSDDINQTLFKDVVTSSFTFSENLNKANELYNKQNINELFSEFVKLILNNGIKDGLNNNNSSEIIIYKAFKEFMKTEIKNINKNYLYMDEKGINKIFKSFFIPGMLLFNDYYEKNKLKNNLITFSIKKYLSDDNSEKLGGTMKNINEQLVKEINNFEEISKMEIDNISNLFLFEFIDSFLINDEAGVFWTILNRMIAKFEEFTKDKFLNCAINNSYEDLYKKFVKFVEYRLCFPNIVELEIFVKFLTNIADFILNELYTKKLIYFFPEKLFYKFKNIITLLQNQIKRISPFKEILFEHYHIINNNNVFVELKINNNKKDIKFLCKECMKKYIKILIKIISDKNIKKTEFKCELLNNIILELILEEEYFSDEEIFYIFNFINEIQNDLDYKRFISDFMKIFEDKLIERDNSFTKLGNRFHKLFKKKENNDLLRIILNILYNNMNSSLSKLEEIFGEYKFKPRSNGGNNLPNLNDNNNYELNEEDEEINELNNIIGIPFIRNVIMGNRPGVGRIIRVGVINLNQGRNIQQLSDKEKLEILNSSMKDTSNQFVKLINFYKISNDIIELYDFNNFENKYLNNLFISLFNIVFSPNNSEKITDANVINSYKKLIEVILKFYLTVFRNIFNSNQENIIKELAKRRNLYHLKEILNAFNKLNDAKKDKKNNVSIRTKNFNEFLIKLEKLIPEEETTKDININSNGNSALKSEDKNLCNICADSIVDTHIIPCEHSICRNCLFQCLSGNKICPFCRVAIQGIKEDLTFKI